MNVLRGQLWLLLCVYVCCHALQTLVNSLDQRDFRSQVSNQQPWVFLSSTQWARWSGSLLVSGPSCHSTGFLPSKPLLATGNCWLFNKAEINHKEKQVKCFIAHFGKGTSPCSLIFYLICKKGGGHWDAWIFFLFFIGSLVFSLRFYAVFLSVIWHE